MRHTSILLFITISTTISISIIASQRSDIQTRSTDNTYIETHNQSQQAAHIIRSAITSQTSIITSQTIDRTSILNESISYEQQTPPAAIVSKSTSSHEYTESCTNPSCSHFVHKWHRNFNILYLNEVAQIPHNCRHSLQQSSCDVRTQFVCCMGTVTVPIAITCATAYYTMACPVTCIMAACLPELGNNTVNPENILPS